MQNWAHSDVAKIHHDQRMQGRRRHGFWLWDDRPNAVSAYA